MVYLFDQKSLYPHCFLGANLFTPLEGGWHGSEIFPSELTNEFDGIKGSYNPVQGKIEEVIQWLYNERVKVPKTDPKNLAFKIILNTVYGVSGSPKFKSVFSLTTASDCTALARRNIKYARYRFTQQGYECLYTDSDSVFVKDPFNDEEKIIKLSNDISEEQRKAFNIYIPTHGLALECKIQKMWFFRDDQGNFIAKNYIYVKDNDEIVEKGLQIVKGNCSPFALKVYNEHIRPLFLRGDYCHFSYDNLSDTCKRMVEGNEHLLIKRFRTFPLENYKIAEGKDEATSMSAQITKRYSAGEHWLCPNKKIGVGKGVKYATIEEMKEKYGTDWVQYVDMNKVLEDLRIFITFTDRKRIKCKESI